MLAVAVYRDALMLALDTMREPCVPPLQIVYIGLGSNLDNPQGQLEQAVESLGRLRSCTVQAVSSLYRSHPLGPPGQPDYVNAVVCIRTFLEPWELLDVLQEIERWQGREREERWGARTLDMDILMYGRRRIDDARLRIPHPELSRRNFVLLPLAELEPGLTVPGLGPISALLEACPPNPIRPLFGKGD